MENEFQKQISGLITEAIETVYKERLPDIAANLEIDPESLGEYIYSKVEIPRDRKMADYSFPTFILAPVVKEKPPEIAKKLADYIDKPGYSSLGPYLNIKLDTGQLAGAVLPLIFQQGDQYGSRDIGAGRKIVIDFSSPNIAKPFGVGHLRSTALGNSLYRIYEKLGFKSIGINHLGDWGTQFGKMIVAYNHWGNKEQLENKPIRTLFDLYVRFHREEEDDPSLSDEARATFKKLEEGDQDAAELWQLFKDYSLVEFKRIYDILGVEFDYYTGESFYNDKMDDVIECLQKAGLAVESQGALVVELEEYDLPACLLKKADGATLYATRDLAGLFYRHKEFDFYKALYVVGGEQKIHFRQVFKVVELLGEDYADRLVHVDFGWIRFKDKAMSTRKGNVIFLEDVINTAIEKATKIIREKNPNLPNLEETAQTVAVGAIVFADLSVKKHKDVNFSWDEVLNFEGETGPYLQYTHARLSALIRKYGREITDDVDFELYKSDEEKNLIMHLYRFTRAIDAAAEKYEPNIIIEYLLELAAVFNRFYQHKDDAGNIIRIISDNLAETEARMLLVKSVRTVLREGLRLLGIKAPDEM